MEWTSPRYERVVALLDGRRVTPRQDHVRRCRACMGYKAQALITSDGSATVVPCLSCDGTGVRRKRKTRGYGA